jgi:hypothetical protein
MDRLGLWLIGTTISRIHWPCYRLMRGQPFGLVAFTLSKALDDEEQA